MRKLIFSSTVLACFLSGCYFFEGARAQIPHPPGFHSSQIKADQDPGVIGTRRQITQIGPRSGEAYFSPDGQKLILQSERHAGNPFYQIYSLDLKTGRSEMLSTGQGKTTCAWFHPSMKKALFASTHQDKEFAKKVKEEEDLRKSAQKNKYSWSFDDQFEIFEVDLKTKKLKALTKAKGYDAEGSYSPDGKWIAFASNRTGYTENLSADDRKLFEQDPSSQMEIYIMKSDGTEVKRLTSHVGYDGGPFFSADGKKITWRRFTPNGASAEIWTMNLDGSDAKELTRMKAMSWAPYFHPSGDYLIFTTNKLGYSNFELYIVDAEGKQEPVRASYLEGFDGLPVFSPDGQTIAWTHKDEKGESQVYLANWDDTKARELLKLAPRMPQNLLGSYSPQDAKQLVGSLANPARAGRLSGSIEEKQLTQEIAQLMRSFGLQPIQKDFVQTFEFASGIELGAKNTFKVSDQGKTTDLKLEKDFLPLSFSASGEFAEAAVAFAGYGLVATANETEPAYDSYKDLDVNGKWVLVFRDIPEEIPNPRRIFLNQFSRLHHKALVAKKAGALGLILVSPGAQQKVMKLRFDGSFAEAGLPVLSVTEDLASAWLKKTGTSLKDWQKQLDTGAIKGVSEIPQMKLQAQVDLKEIKSSGRNVVGILKVPGATQTVMIGAHGDHLGRGEIGSSLAKGTEQGNIHLGADDNASGVAALLMIAQDLSLKVKSGEWKPKQNIAFAVWSAEEIGLLGSKAFLKDNKLNISSYLNMDMVGRLRETLSVQGAGSAKEWRSVLEPLAVTSNLSMSIQEDPYLPTDSMSFYLKQIPTLSFFTGAHSEYHTPNDRPETLNFDGISSVAKMVSQTAQTLAASGPRPIKLTYQKVESSHKQMEGRSFRVYLGTIPDYAQEKVKGVRISGTSKESPAEKAGLKEGDVIQSLAGTKVENIYDYVYILQSLKANQKIPIEVRRAEQILKLEITPALKE